MGVLNTKIKSYIFLKIITLFLVLGLFLIPISIVNGATSSDLNNLLNQKSKLSSDINTKQKQAEEKKKQADALNTALKTINDNISISQNKINDLQSQIDQTERDINDTQKQIIDKQNQLDQEKSKQNETIRLMYEQNQQNTLYLIIGSKTLSEAIDKVQYFETLENKIEKTMEEISKLKKDLETKSNDLNNKKSNLASMKSEQEAYKQGLVQQQNEKKVVLSDVNSQKKQLDAQVTEAKKMSSQVEAQIAQIQAQLSSNNSSRTVMARDRGTSAVGFSWPIDYKYISAYYGDQTPFQQFHTGIDLVNILGTPVHATAPGTVITSAGMKSASGGYYGYGNYVVIGHNARFSSLYGHLMYFTVSAGDEVKAGDIIGYLGNTGWSTGPHLHLEIWDYGVRKNPISYLP